MSAENQDEIKLAFNSIDELRSQIKTAREVQKERIDLIESTTLYYGGGRYKYLTDLIGEVDSERQAELARAVCWDLAIRLALLDGDARESELAPIFDGISTEIVMTKVTKIMDKVRLKFPKKD